MDRKRLTRRMGSLAFATGMAWALAMGCGSSDDRIARPLTAEQFAARGATIPPDGGRLTGAPVDQAGAIRYDGAGRPADERASPPADPNPGRSDQRISPVIDQTIKRPDQRAADPAVNLPPTTARVDLNDLPAAPPPAVEIGGPRAVDIGFVVMEVNGKPIYSDMVLSALERPLAAEAKNRGAEGFRAHARQLLEQQVQLYKRDELEVASADLALDAAEKKLAKMLTMHWRQQQITAAGGSLEVARQRARDDGWDFDDLVQREYRRKLVQIFYQKRILPKIFVPPADQRAYYERNKAKEFSTPSRLKFRVIKIDPKEPGFVSNDAAQQLAREVQKRAQTEDFAKLADEINKNDRGGAIGLSDSKGWVDANSYVHEEVEQAVSKLQPGQVTDVIEGDDRLLFIAKLEAIQAGKVQPFEDPAVQEAIFQKLRGMQFNALREAHVRRLENEAVTRRNEGKIDDMLAIVMRKYPEWAKPG